MKDGDEEDGIDTDEPRADRLVALADWYVAEHARLVRFAYVLTRDGSLSEDVVQDAFVRLHRSKVPLEPDRMRAYAQRTIVNLVRSTFRRRGIERRILATLAAEPVTERATNAEGAVDLRAALLRLPIADRACLALRYFDGRTDREIAEVLGIGHEAAKKRVTRAHARLRALLGKDGP